MIIPADVFVVHVPLTDFAKNIFRQPVKLRGGKRAVISRQSAPFLVLQLLWRGRGDISRLGFGVRIGGKSRGGFTLCFRAPILLTLLTPPPSEEQR